jgi:hypothetical protein
MEGSYDIISHVSQPSDVNTLQLLECSIVANLFLSLHFHPLLFLSKAVPLHAMEALGGERRYSSYSFSTSALDGDEWSASRPGRALPHGKGPPDLIVQEAGWAPEPVWTQKL